MDESILTRPAPRPDRSLRYGLGPEQIADGWIPAAAGKPRVVFIHGGFWRPRYDRTHTRVLCAALRDAGWPVVSIEYRRVPGQPDLTADDVRTALSVLLGQVPGEGTIVMGHSAGGHLALWASAACPPPDLVGTVGLAAVADLRAAHEADLGDGAVEAFLGAEPGGRADLDPVLLKPPDAPVVLLHGDGDTTVPVSQSESFVDAHPEAKIVELAGMAHFELIDPVTPAWQALVAELDALQPG